MFLQTGILFQRWLEEDVNAEGEIEVTNEVAISGVKAVVILLYLPGLCDEKEHSLSIALNKKTLCGGSITQCSMIGTCPLPIVKQKNNFSVRLAGLKEKKLRGKMTIVDASKFQTSLSGDKATGVYLYYGKSDQHGIATFDKIEFYVPGITITRLTFNNTNNCHVGNYRATVDVYVDGQLYPKVIDAAAASKCDEFWADMPANMTGDDFSIQLTLNGYAGNVASIEGNLVVEYTSP